MRTSRRAHAVLHLAGATALGCASVLWADSARADVTLTVTSCSADPTTSGTLPFEVDSVELYLGQTVTIVFALDCNIDLGTAGGNPMVLDEMGPGQGRGSQSFPNVIVDGTGHAITITNSVYNSIGQGNVFVATIPPIIRGNGGGSLTLRNLTIQNAAGTAIVNGVLPVLPGIPGPPGQPNLTLDGVVIQNNTSPGNAGGIDNAGILTLENGTSITGNKALAASGGGIFNESVGTVNALDGTTTISNNGADEGGGIWNDGGNVTMAGGTITGNNAGDGGGIENAPGGTVTLAKFNGKGVLVSNNQAMETHGGALNNGQTGVVMITGAMIMNNSAAGLGGAIYNAQGGTITVDSTTIAAPSIPLAAQGGGGVFNSGGTVTFQNLTYIQNCTALVGGGVLNSAGTTYFSSSFVQSNTALASCPSTCVGQFEFTANGVGGGIYNGALGGGPGSVVNAGMTIVEGNTSTMGAGVYNDSSSTLTLTNSTVSNNTTVQAAGADGNGAGIYNNEVLNLVASTVFQNTAVGPFGGGIYTTGGALQVENSTVANNTITANPGPGSGSGIYVAAAGIGHIVSSTVSGNVFGGLFSKNSATLASSIVASNGAMDVSGSQVGAVVSFGNNLLGSVGSNLSLQAPGGFEVIASATNAQVEDQANVSSPGLAPSLAANGGPTDTLAVLPGSLAIGAGNCTGAVDEVPIATDQRGFLRKPTCDVGAYETNPPMGGAPFSPASQVLSLTNPAEWTVSNGSGRPAAPVTAGGPGSLSVAGTGWVTVTSVPLSSQDIVANSGANLSEVTYDLYIPLPQPNLYWVGATQMYLSSPSAGVSNVYLGQVELTGQHTQQFVPQRFSVPAQAMAALTGSHDDVTITIVLNVNSGTGPWLLGQVHFGS